MKASPPTQAAVQATLQHWKDAYSQQNLDGALAVIAPDADVVGIGTGPDEWRVGPGEFKAQLERDFVHKPARVAKYDTDLVNPHVAILRVRRCENGPLRSFRLSDRAACQSRGHYPPD